MPLARIRTSHTDIPFELKRQLSDAGFAIEVVGSDETGSGEADIELMVDAESVQAVMNDASMFAGNVYVAPASLDSALTQNEGAITSAADEQVQAVERESRMRREREAVQLMLEQRAESERLRLEAEREAQRHAEIERKRRELELAEQARLARERIRAEKAEALKQEELRQQEFRRQEQLRREEELRLRAEKEREELLRANDEKKAAEIAAQRRAEEERAAQAERLRRAEEERNLQIQRALLHAEEERLRAELKRKQSELEERERQWEAEKARLEQELSKREQLSKVVPISAPVAGQQLPAAIGNVVPAANPGTLPIASAKVKQISAAIVEGSSRRLRHKEYRRAALTAGALSLVIMGLWIALESRTPANPVSVPDLVRSNGIEQKSPFGAATISAPVAVKQEPATAAQTANLEPAAQPAPITTKPSPARKSSATRRNAGTDDQEVVVRHFGTRTADAKKSRTTKDKVKVFSDLD